MIVSGQAGLHGEDAPELVVQDKEKPQEQYDNKLKMEVKVVKAHLPRLKRVIHKHVSQLHLNVSKISILLLKKYLKLIN